MVEIDKVRIIVVFVAHAVLILSCSPIIVFPFAKYVNSDELAAVMGITDIQVLHVFNVSI